MRHTTCWGLTCPLVWREQPIEVADLRVSHEPDFPGNTLDEVLGGLRNMLLSEPEDRTSNYVGRTIDQPRIPLGPIQSDFLVSHRRRQDSRRLSLERDEGVAIERLFEVPDADLAFLMPATMSRQSAAFHF